MSRRFATSINSMMALASGGMSNSARPPSAAELLDPTMLMEKVKAKLNPKSSETSGDKDDD